MTPLLITIASDAERIEMTVKFRTLDDAKEYGRKLWAIIEQPRILVIKDLNTNQKLFVYETKKHP